MEEKEHPEHPQEEQILLEGGEHTEVNPEPGRKLSISTASITITKI